MSAERTSPLPRLRLALIGALGAAVAAAGFWILIRYERQSGPLASVPALWPEAAGLEADGHRPTLLLFAHPHCPCTRATVDELDRIAARCRDRLRIVAVFLSEPGLGDTWTESDLWRKAGRIPGVELRADPRGTIAERFGVHTSGHTILYDSRGRLLFEGGITGSRGHAGDNPGESAVVAWVLEGNPGCTSTPVYGCLLASPSPDPVAEASP